MVLLVLAMFTILPVFAGGGQEKETAVFLKRTPSYIAAGKPETGKDSLLIENIQLDIDKNTAIKRYDLKVYNKNGEVIFEKSDAKLEGRGFLGDLFNVGEIPSIKVPASMSWPGTDMKGKFVADGEYFYQLTILDSFGKKSSTAPLSVVVDTVAPEIVSLTPTARVFSPNGDGIQDSLSFQFRTGNAHIWTEEILDEKSTVIWKKTTTAPGETATQDQVMRDDTVWDGKANQGSTAVAGEGSYSYRLTGADRANNQVQKSVDFKISMSGSDVALTIQETAKAYKPGMAVTLLPSIKDSKGLVSWAIEAYDKSNILQRRVTAKGVVPASIEWNLTGNPGRAESEGAALKDGTYKVSLKASYDSGAVTESAALEILVDGTPPFAGIEADTRNTATQRGQALRFGSPLKSLLAIRVVTENGPDWLLEIRQKSGDVVFEAPLAELFGAPNRDNDRDVYTYEWDGSLPPPLAGMLPDGTYQALVKGSDSAGNLGTSNTLVFQRSLKDLGTLTVATDTALFDPTNNSGSKRLNAQINLEKPENLKTFTLQVIRREKGGDKVELSQTDTKVIPALVWTGKRNSGEDAAIGVYVVRAIALYNDGESIEADSPSFELRRDGAAGNMGSGNGRPPVLGISVDRALFTPDGDGNNDEATVQLMVNEGSEPVTAWKLEIFDPAAQLFRSWEGTGKTPQQIVWNGKSSKGEIVQSAMEYFLELTVTDALNNKTKADTQMLTGILLEKTPYGYKISLPSVFFSGNTNDLFDDQWQTIYRNIGNLQNLARMLLRMKEYRISIIGHATYVSGKDPVKRAKEQKETLLPLSQARALEVRQSLAILGVQWERMESSGMGGEQPIVPHEDTTQRWKNRRVEFLLKQ